MFVCGSKSSLGRIIKFSSFVVRLQTDNYISRANLSKYSRLTNPAEPEKYKTVGQLKEELRIKMGVAPGFEPLSKNRSSLLEKLPKSQAELPPRSMRDSYDSAVIPLSTEMNLQNSYVNFLGTVRLGRLMEDMDIFAVNIVFKYILNPAIQEGDIVPHVIATILVDSITISEYKSLPNKDIRISGHVSWVGKTSVEVSVWLEQHHNGVWNEITHAIFLMASRNSTNTAGSFLNKLVPLDDLEKQILAEGEKRKKIRTKEGQTSLLKLHPTSEEQDVLHLLFMQSLDISDLTMETRLLPSGCVWMSESKQSNIIFSHPESRNLHNKVFGGFLMRLAAEIAFMTAYIHSKTCCPSMRYCGGISFNRPVDVGSLVAMTGQVVYAEQKFVQIAVYAKVLDPHSTKKSTSNIFNYTYECSDMVQKVMPNTYSDAMLYIDGRRHFQDAFGLK